MTRDNSFILLFFYDWLSVLRHKFHFIVNNTSLWATWSLLPHSNNYNVNPTLEKKPIIAKL